MSGGSGSAVMDRSNRRRWLISAAIVLLIHICIAAAVLTWRHMNASLPVLVDLTPAPSASLQRATLPAPEQPSPQHTTPQQNTQSASASASASAPVDDHASPPPPIEPTASNESTAPPAGAAPTYPLPNSPVTNTMADMPLDTSITVQPPLHGNAGVAPFGHSSFGNSSFGNGEVGPLANREVGSDGAPFDQRPASIFRPAKPFGVPDVPRNSLLPNGNPVLSNPTLSVPGIGLKNLSGANVQDRTHAAMARLAARAQTAKNSIGSSVIGIAVPNSAWRNGLTSGATANGIESAMTAIASRGDANGGDGATRNAIGVTANFRPRIPRAAVGEAGPGVLAVAGHDMPHAPIINGRGLVRPLGGPGVIGGPARRAGAGALSGSDFRLKRP